MATWPAGLSEAARAAVGEARASVAQLQAAFDGDGVEPSVWASCFAQLQALALLQPPVCLSDLAKFTSTKVPAPKFVVVWEKELTGLLLPPASDAHSRRAGSRGGDNSRRGRGGRRELPGPQGATGGRGDPAEARGAMGGHASGLKFTLPLLSAQPQGKRVKL